MNAVEREGMDRIAPLFDGWNETLLWSCLQGYMGNAWADDTNCPRSAQIVTGDFCFFAGVANRELVRNIPKDFSSPCILMIPQNEQWADLIEKEYQSAAHRFLRYATKKEPDVFDCEKLYGTIHKLSAEYQLKKINKEIFNRVRGEEWSADLCSQFSVYDNYAEYGLGFVVLDKDEIVCGASSYTVYKQGIEIEIDTKPSHRRKGLALVCASQLIIECLKRGIYPSWDAANLESLALSEKLGYHFDQSYVAYSVNR